MSPMTTGLMPPKAASTYLLCFTFCNPTTTKQTKMNGPKHDAKVASAAPQMLSVTLYPT